VRGSPCRARAAALANSERLGYSKRMIESGQSCDRGPSKAANGRKAPPLPPPTSGSEPIDKAANKRVMMTTHKVVIDANDESHAADLYERLWNDGYRVHRETHKLVRLDNGNIGQEVERVG